MAALGKRGMTKRSSGRPPHHDVSALVASPAGVNLNTFATIYPIASAQITRAPIGLPIMREGFITDTGLLPAALATPRKL